MGNLFQQKHATEKEDTTSPEHYLWTSVLSKAAHDAIYSSDWREARAAMEWFKSPNRSDFKKVCELAGRDSNYVYTHIIKRIKEREAHMEWIKTGQRYYVKDNNALCRHGIVYHSHYRHGKKRGPYKKKKKHLTGNSYYAAKRKKDPYYFKMGKLGGRPRMYNHV